MTEYRFSKDDIPERRSPEGVGRFGRLLFDPKVIPGAQCSMAILRYNAGGIGPAHEHKSEVEVFFGLQGVGQIEFLGKAHRLEPGIAIYVPPKTHEPIAWMHTTGMSDTTCPWVNGTSTTQDAKYIAIEKGTDNGRTVPNPIPTRQSGAHVCVDFAGCKKGYPAKICTFNGPHTNISSDPGIYPPEATRQRLLSLKTPSDDEARIMNRVWTQVKTGK